MKPHRPPCTRLPAALLLTPLALGCAKMAEAPAQRTAAAGAEFEVAIEAIAESPPAESRSAPLRGPQLAEAKRSAATGKGFADRAGAGAADKGGLSAADGGRAQRVDAPKADAAMPVTAAPAAPHGGAPAVAPIGAAAEAQARESVGGRAAVRTPEEKAANDDEAEKDAGSTEAEDACGPVGEAPRPLPRRCHLASNYRAGQGVWQRRLESLAALPPELRGLAAAAGPGGELLPPETKALAVAARLDRSHLDGPGQVWMRVSLRSTDRWGMRRPPFDLAVVVGADAAQAPDQRACRTLEALVQRVEPQDRLTLIRGGDDAETLDGLAGAEALARVRALCASGAGWATAPLADQHRRARQLLARHAQAQHRVAGSRLVVVIATAADLADPQLLDSVSQGVSEPTLSSALVLDGAGLDRGWQLADAGHGLLEPVAADPDGAARRLWYGWGRVVARLVRVDLRLAPGVVALRVVGSRVLDQQETQRVRRQETAVDQNLARVAGVKRDRQQDGEGMTMLISAFLGSDEHVIDVLLEVAGPGPVADVVVDYKDLVRMNNEKAMARAALARVSAGAARPLPAIARPAFDRLDWPQLAAVRRAIADHDEAALEALVQALQERPEQQPLAVFAAALQAALREASAVEPLLAALDVFVARGRGCHVAARGP